MVRANLKWKGNLGTMGGEGKVRVRDSGMKK